MLQRIVSLGMVITLFLGIWKVLILVTNSEYPVIVVVSDDVEPHYNRGDLLLLTSWDEPIEAGDILAFKLSKYNVVIVHRAIIV